MVELFHEGKEEWEQSGNPEDGNVAIIFRFGDMLHTGIVILGGSQILHVQEGLETVHEPISRFHVEGIYRRPEGER